MPRQIFPYPYKEKESGIFGKTKRPLIDLRIFSETRRNWLLVAEVLADTGADISILPRTIGEELVSDIKKGRYLEIRGITPGAYTEVFIHNLICKIGESFKFKAPFAIADSDDVPPILGRFKGLDLFEAIFYRGKETRLLTE